MGVGQEQRDLRSLSSFHISQQIVDVMHISLSRGDFFFFYPSLVFYWSIIKSLYLI